MRVKNEVLDSTNKSSKPKKQENFLEVDDFKSGKIKIVPILYAEEEENE